MPLMNRVLTALLLSLAACAAPSAAQGGSIVEPPQGGQHLGVELSTLIRDLTMSDGRRVVSLELRNDAERAIQFTWAVEWIDSAGVTCPGTPSDWQEARLMSGASMAVQIKAPNPQAASWRIVAVEAAL